MDTPSSSRRDVTYIIHVNCINRCYFLIRQISWTRPSARGIILRCLHDISWHRRRHQYLEFSHARVRFTRLLSAESNLSGNWPRLLSRRSIELLSDDDRRDAAWSRLSALRQADDSSLKGIGLSPVNRAINDDRMKLYINRPSTTVYAMTDDGKGAINVSTDEILLRTYAHA